MLPQTNEQAHQAAAADAGLSYDLGARVGRTVRRFREFEGLAQAELAERAGLTQAAVSQIENGKRINNLNTLERLALALGMALSELILFAEKGRDKASLEAEVRRLTQG